jgi:iduronate 2-sulfatase
MRTIESIGELIDLFPTIVDVAGLPEVPSCSNSLEYIDESITCTEGKSLYQRMSDEADSSDGEAFSQFPRPGPVPTRSPDSDQPKLSEIRIMGYSIRTRRFRYTAWIKFNNKKFKRSETLARRPKLFS